MVRTPARAGEARFQAGAPQHDSDELEKSLGTGQNTLDGGTTSRVFGSFLSWMQDKQAAVFVVATANDVSALPPEMLRKGRFDELFFSDLPTTDEREEILRIHLRRLNRDPSRYDLRTLADACKNFSGAELAQVLIDAMFVAFQENREPSLTDMVAAATATTPLHDTMPERIASLREWGRTRAVPANRSQPTPRPAAGRHVVVGRG